jgi:hypothetical protein
LHKLGQPAFVDLDRSFGQVKPPRLPLALLWPVIQLPVDPEQEDLHLTEQSSFGELLLVIDADRVFSSDCAD